jgi:CTP:molybdopterin cytidylyltransferase MocA
MKIAMIILAAGFSERMGVLKPLLPVGGESALLRAVGLGRHEKIHSISIVTGHRHEEVQAELMKCGAKNIRHIHNAKYAEGMFTSVKAGIHSLPGDIDGFLLLPVDHCAVRPETLEKVIAAYIL